MAGLAIKKSFESLETKRSGWLRIETVACLWFRKLIDINVFKLIDWADFIAFIVVDLGFFRAFVGATPICRILYFHVLRTIW